MKSKNKAVRNFYNVDYVKHTNTHKTKSVINYVEHLEEPNTNDFKVLHRFRAMIKKALSKKTPDEMLFEIGYKPLGQDNIYNWCLNKRKIKGEF